MATLFRWPSGFDAFASLRHMQREFERFFGRGPLGAQDRIGGGAYPPVNVLNGSDDMIIECEMAGVNRDDIEISITGETLVIKGSKGPSADEEKVRYQVRERGSGEFSRTIVLPDKVDTDHIEAKLANGVLTVRLPKSEAGKPKKIDVK